MPSRRSAPRKLILKNGYATGDIVVMTAAVRDLHLRYPGRFLTDVRTPSAEIWEHNPHLTDLDDTAKGVEVIDCHPELIQNCNDTPYHYLQSYAEFLNRQLGLNITPTAFHGDIHLSPLEKSWYSQVHERTGEDTPFWVIASGGKRDVTIKWWSSERYQQVVDHFRGRIQFVQVGAAADHHPPLSGVIDLRGQTDLRQLIRLVYHSQGVLCGVTCLMHLAAAIERKDTGGHDRACVVIAGAREPAQWEAYPAHQFIHSIGQLPCAKGGCWRSRVRPLGDGDERDGAEHLCLDVIRDLPRCMDLISAEEVIRRIERYYDGGSLPYLTPGAAQAAHRAISPGFARPAPVASWTPDSSEYRMEGRTHPPVADEGRNTGRRPAITLVTLHDPPMAEVGAITSARLQAYAQRQGYPIIRYERLLDASRPAAWNKVLAVRNALLSQQSEWVMWVDADAYIMNLDFPAASLIDGSAEIQMLCASDENGLNTGVFLLREGDWSIRFLEAIHLLGEPLADPDGYAPLWEQSTFKHLIRCFPDVARRVRVLPQAAMNSSPSSYRHGEFIVHLSGMPNEQRLEMLPRLHALATESPSAPHVRRR